MATPPPSPAVPFRGPSRSLPIFLFVVLVLAAFVASVKTAQVDFFVLVEAESRRNLFRFLFGMFPPDLSLDFLRLMLPPVLETIQISIMGTTIAILVGLPLGLLATSSLTWGGVLHEMGTMGQRSRRLLRVLPYAFARGLLSVFRAIPEFVWALIFVRAVGLGPFPGVLAIGVAYGGILGKVYSEILESVDPKPLEALQATGASKLQIVLYGLLPQAFPDFVSYSLYRWECAIRASAILGFVGAGGIGQQLELSMRMFNFHEVTTLIGLLALLVAAADLLSARIRKGIL
ncbi:MAG: phosphonate ABC transporter, permease protein PhnE [candidate division NC10 bacterium]|nr:phosphonate ABC transporter, permease protein PhnE [candidate division NC10 bacterium]